MCMCECVCVCVCVCVCECVRKGQWTLLHMYMNIVIRMQEERRGERDILNSVCVASSPALSPAFIACSMKSGEPAYLHEFEKSWGRPGNEASVCV